MELLYPLLPGCAPYDVDFMFTGTNATVFEWSIDTTIISTLPNHNYTFTEPGTYNVQLAVLNPTPVIQEILLNWKLLF